VALAAGLLALVGVAAFVAWPRPDRITRENFDRIKVGMSRAEVEAILGPPGDYRTGPVAVLQDTGTSDLDTPYIPRGLRDCALWLDDNAWVIFYFDEAGFVMIRWYDPAVREEQTPLDNLIWRAKRQWRTWFPE
jgi:hypothetical protein